MPRYLVESTGDHDDAAGRPSSPDPGVVIEPGGLPPTTWICSYVSETRTFALYDGPNPEAVRRAARDTGLAVRQVFQVERLDPHAHHAASPRPGIDGTSGEGHGT